MQLQLDHAYEEWKRKLRLSDGESSSLGPPLLLKVSPAYISSRKRVLIVGQETYGWSWTAKSTARYRYPSWHHGDFETAKDFLRVNDSVAALTAAYGLFDFGRHQGLEHTPFWKAFNQINLIPDVAAIWTNIVRMDFAPDKSLNGHERNALANKLTGQQKDLFARELEILKPNACIFLTGPNYDRHIVNTFTGSTFSPISPWPERRYATVAAASLPSMSLRTYHPSYLSRSKQWHIIDDIKNRIREL